MTQGLQVWDGAGRLSLSLTDRLAKILGAVFISGNGSLALPVLQGNVYFFLFVPSSYAFNAGDVYPAVSVSGNQLSWVYVPGDLGGSNYVTGVLHYGAY